MDAMGGLLSVSKSLITTPPAVVAKMPPAPQRAGAGSSTVQAPAAPQHSAADGSQEGKHEDGQLAVSPS
jgi:hypothetical protein